MRYTGRQNGKLYEDDGPLLTYTEECFGNVVDKQLRDGEYKLRIDDVPNVVFVGKESGEVYERARQWVLRTLRQAAFEQKESSTRPDSSEGGA